MVANNVNKASVVMSRIVDKTETSILTFTCKVDLNLLRYESIKNTNTTLMHEITR